MSAYEYDEQEWLAKGEKREQARIIKLLEGKCQCHTGMSNGYMVKKICPAHNHIALIKGENK